jgi:hypothetical protein
MTPKTEGPDPEMSPSIMEKGEMQPYANPVTKKHRELVRAKSTQPAYASPHQTSDHKKSAPPYVKPEVRRFQSASLSIPEDDELEDGEMRARFYSYRGMRLKAVASRVGALKKPMPLPDEATELTTTKSDQQYNSPYAVLERPLRVSEYEPELEYSIEELDEEEEEEEEEQASGSSLKYPEHYLDPVSLKGKK